MQNNAIQNVRNSLSDLNQAKMKLNEALSTAEKQENKQMIQNSISSLTQSINQIENTINNYKEN